VISCAPIDHVGVVLASVWTADLSAKLLKALLPQRRSRPSREFHDL